jgi:putative phosphoribosyl transferase
VILVDDSLATGSTMRSAVAAVRRRGPPRVVVAVPVAPVPTCNELELVVDRLVRVVRAHHLVAVGEWYEDFAQTGDAEVWSLLLKHRSEGVTPTCRSSEPGRCARQSAGVVRPARGD